MAGAGGPAPLRGRVRPEAARRGARGGEGGRPGADRLRLRLHHRQGGGALARARAALHLLRAVARAIRSRTRSRSSARCDEAGYTEVGGLALTGYGKDLLRDVVGADVAVVETVAHATGTLHFHPDADVICDVGGTDVKIMILRQGTVADFRLNSQCSSGQRRVPPGRGRALLDPARGLRGPGLRGQGDADPGHGLRRIFAVRHRQPAAQGLGRGGDHGRARRGAAGQRVDLRRAAAEPPMRSGASSCSRAARTGTWRW